MKGILSRRPSTGAIALVIAVLVVLGGVAIAAIPDGTGVIHACYNKKSGNLRVTDPTNTAPKAKPKACNTKSEASLDWNQTGPPGQKGDKGDTGPAGSSPPPPPPDPYTGTFALQIDGSAPVTLSSFAGCFDKKLGVEYQDCYFQVKGLSDPVEQWLVDTTRGNNLRHDLTVFQLSATNQVLGRVEIQEGFLSDFRVSDFDASSSDSGALDFVVVPHDLKTFGAGGTATRTSPTPFAVANFSADIDSIDGSRIATIRDIHMSASKVLSAGPGRHVFDPGHPQFDDVAVSASSTGGTTAADLNTWADNVGAGNQDRRQAAITLRNAAFQTVGELDLDQLSPVSALEPFGTRRSISFAIESFGF